MQKLRKILILLFLISLNSCSIPEIEDLEQCSPEFHFILEDGKRYINEDLSTCRCRMYQRKPEYIGPVGDFWHNDISYCNKLIGESPDNYLEVFNFLNEIRIKYNSFSSKNK